MLNLMCVSFIIEGIKAVLFFFYEKISQAQKAQKAQIAKKADFH